MAGSAGNDTIGGKVQKIGMQGGIWYLCHFEAV
jgi:hypothetical protein